MTETIVGPFVSLKYIVGICTDLTDNINFYLVLVSISKILIKFKYGGN